MAKSIKKRLTATEEFEIMKLVLDKVLWVGVAIMLVGLYRMATADMKEGLLWMAVGAIVLIIFVFIIVKEYEVIK